MVALMSVLQAQTRVENEWISQRLAMGHNRLVSRRIPQGNDKAWILFRPAFQLSWIHLVRPKNADLAVKLTLPLRMITSI